ncbi:MAG: hypothetical protein ABIR59_09200 [Gemmatimonadales bacterium]
MNEPFPSISAAESTRVRFFHRTWPWGVVVLTIAAGLLAWSCVRGWYPHDEGLLGQSAERVLRGEIPHRDFDDPYTGGLALVHALAFSIFGIRLTVLRYVVAFAAFCWLSGIFFLARRWLSAPRASLLTLLVLVWSVPIYPAAIPSWYVLFLVTASAAVVIVWRVDKPRAALISSGLLLGVGMTIKITALFGLAGLLLALARQRQTDPGRVAASWEIVGGAPLFMLLCAMLVQPLASPRVLIHVAGPAMVLALGLWLAELRALSRHRRIAVDRELCVAGAWLVTGCAIPVVGFGLWLASHSALEATLHSFAAVTAKRASFAAAPPPPPVSLLYAAAAVALLIGPIAKRVNVWLLGLMLASVFVLGWVDWPWHRGTWLAVRGMMPVGAAACAVLWACRRPIRDDLPLTVLAMVAASMALTQYPFASPIYALYVLPLMLVAVFAFEPQDRSWSARRDLFAGFLILFALTQVIPGARALIGIARSGASDLVQLDVARGGLRIQPTDAATYRRLIDVIDSIGGDSPIWAGPDAPEVAFLAGRRPSGRSFFDFLAEPDAPAPWNRTDSFASDVVVVNTKPPFSGRLSRDELAVIRSRYPRTTTVDHFIVFSRAPR